MGQLVKPLVLNSRISSKYKCAFRHWGCPGTIGQITKYADGSPGSTKSGYTIPSNDKERLGIPDAEENQYLCDTCGVLYIGHSFKRVSDCQPNLSQVASWLNTHRALHEKWENRKLWRRLTRRVLRKKKPTSRIQSS